LPRKLRSLVSYVGHGDFRLDRHERLLTADNSLIEFLQYQRAHIPEPKPEDIPRLTRLELAVVMQLCYRHARRAGRESALPYAQAFRDLILHGETDKAAQFFLEAPDKWLDEPAPPSWIPPQGTRPSAIAQGKQPD
jgi:hypothetical protein